MTVNMTEINRMTKLLIDANAADKALDDKEQQNIISLLNAIEKGIKLPSDFCEALIKYRRNKSVSNDFAEQLNRHQKMELIILNYQLDQQIREMNTVMNLIQGPNSLTILKAELEKIKAKAAEVITNLPTKVMLEECLYYLDKIIKLQEKVSQCREQHGNDSIEPVKLLLSSLNEHEGYKTLQEFSMLAQHLKGALLKEKKLPAEQKTFVQKRMADISITATQFTPRFDLFFAGLIDRSVKLKLATEQYEKLKTLAGEINKKSNAHIGELNDNNQGLQITSELNDGVTLEGFAEIVTAIPAILTGLTVAQFFKEVLKIEISDKEKLFNGEKSIKLSEKPLTVDMLKALSNIAKHTESLKYLCEGPVIKIGLSSWLLKSMPGAVNALPVVDILNINKAYTMLVDAKEPKSSEKKKFIENLNKRFGVSLNQEALNKAINEDKIVKTVSESVKNDSDASADSASRRSTLRGSNIKEQLQINSSNNLLNLYNVQLELEQNWQDIKTKLNDIFKDELKVNRFDVLPWVKKLLAISAIESKPEQRKKLIDTIIKALPFDGGLAENLVKLADLLKKADDLAVQLIGIPLAVIQKRQELGILAANLHNNLAFMQLRDKLPLPESLYKERGKAEFIKELNDEIMLNKQPKTSLEKLHAAKIISEVELEQLTQESKRQALIQRINDNAVNGAIKKVFLANPKIGMNDNLVAELNKFLPGEDSLGRFNTQAFKLWLYDKIKYNLTTLEVVAIKQGFRAAVTAFFQASAYIQETANDQINNEVLRGELLSNIKLFGDHSKGFKKPIIGKVTVDFSNKISADMKEIKTAATQRLKLDKTVKLLETVFKDNELKDFKFMGVSRATLKSYQDLIKTAERKQRALEENCLKSLEAREQILQKEIKQVEQKAQFALKNDKIDAKELKKTIQHLKDISTELQSLRVAIGSRGELFQGESGKTAEAIIVRLDAAVGTTTGVRSNKIDNFASYISELENKVNKMNNQAGNIVEMVDKMLEKMLKETENVKDSFAERIRQYNDIIKEADRLCSKPEDKKAVETMLSKKYNGLAKSAAMTEAEVMMRREQETPTQPIVKRA